MPNSRNVRLVDLGNTPARRFFAATNAVAAASAPGAPYTLLTCVPRDILCSVGSYQDIDRELDSQKLTARGIPVYRRRFGGGASCMDSGALWFSAVVHQSKAEYSISRMCQNLVPAIVATYRAFGADAHFVPPREVHYHETLLSTADVGRVHHALVLASSIVCSRNEEFAEELVPRIPLSSVQSITCSEVRPASVRDVLLKHLAKSWSAEFAAGGLTEEEEKATESEALASDVEPFAGSALIAEMKRKAEETQGLVFHAGKHITGSGNAVFASLLLKGGVIEDVVFSGDFVLYKNDFPELCGVFRGVPAEWAQLMTAVENYYLANHVDTPGVLPTDWVTAIDSAINVT
jgi:lipoate-protein ligase A